MTRGIRRTWLGQIAEIAPIAILSNGFPVYPIQGAEPKEGEDGDGEDEDEDGDDDGKKGGADGDDDSDGDGDDGDGDELDPKDKRIRELSRENAKRRKRLKEAETAKVAAEAKVKEHEDKNKSDLEKATADLESANAKIAQLAESNKKNVIERAFLRQNKHKWHDPETALKLVDMSDVTVDDEGSVDGMKEAVDALAKEHAYLLKRDEDEEEEEGRPSGAAFGKNKKDSKGKQADREALLKKYPTLTRM
jgi:hypothetical protein